MKNPIARYLMCAYAYYEEDDPLISDYSFDMLAKYISQNYDSIQHFHKHLVTKEDLDAGTYLGEYPERVKGAVRDWRGLRKKPKLEEMMPTEKVGLEEFFE